MPLSGAHPRDQRCEPPAAPAVHLDEVSCDQTRTSHRLSLRAAQLAALHVPQNRASSQDLVVRAPEQDRGSPNVAVCSARS